MTHVGRRYDSCGAEVRLLCGRRYDSSGRRYDSCGAEVRLSRAEVRLQSGGGTTLSGRRYDSSAGGGRRAERLIEITHFHPLSRSPLTAPLVIGHAVIGSRSNPAPGAARDRGWGREPPRRTSSRVWLDWQHPDRTSSRVWLYCSSVADPSVSVVHLHAQGQDPAKPLGLVPVSAAPSQAFGTTATSAPPGPEPTVSGARCGSYSSGDPQVPLGDPQVTMFSRWTPRFPWVTPMFSGDPQVDPQFPWDPMFPWVTPSSLGVNPCSSRVGSLSWDGVSSGSWPPSRRGVSGLTDSGRPSVRACRGAPGAPGLGPDSGFGPVGSDLLPWKPALQTNREFKVHHTGSGGPIREQGQGTARRRSCILVMDSLRLSAHENACRLLREYLQVEWQVRRGRARLFTPDTVCSAVCRLPLQDNSSDCGLYLLQYAESFLQNPVVHFDLPTRSIPGFYGGWLRRVGRAHLKPGARGPHRDTPLRGPAANPVSPDASTGTEAHRPRCSTPSQERSPPWGHPEEPGGHLEEHGGHLEEPGVTQGNQGVTQGNLGVT
ncbi:unnamed protein product [Boreogadus saida]